MQEKDFIAYEYTSKTVKAEEQARIADLYEAFGWEIVSVSPTALNGVTLSLRRDRKLKHRQELLRLERQAENTLKTIEGLNRSKTLASGIFAYVFGIIAALVLGGGMCLVMLHPGQIAAIGPPLFPLFRSGPLHFHPGTGGGRKRDRRACFPPSTKTKKNLQDCWNRAMTCFTRKSFKRKERFAHVPKREQRRVVFKENAR